MARTSNKAPSLRRTAVSICRSLAKDLFDPYRPELHYMRGPGPKWRAKHAQAPTEPGMAGSLRTLQMPVFT
jgi:hypothetical protein